MSRTHITCTVNGEDTDFLANPGTLICPSFMGKTMLAGMHGYDPDHPDSVASLLTSAPTDCAPQGLWDMRTYMRETALS